jgi:hypothetical protein
MGKVFVTYSYAVSAIGTKAITCTNIFRQAGARVIEIQTLKVSFASEYTLQAKFSCDVFLLVLSEKPLESPILLETLPEILGKVTPYTVDVSASVA